jgi:hypothetical protein
MAEPQIIEDRYVDRQKLDKFLAENFAKTDYRYEVSTMPYRAYKRNTDVFLQLKFGVYKVYAPRKLTDVN